MSIVTGVQSSQVYHRMYCSLFIRSILNPLTPSLCFLAVPRLNSYTRTITSTAPNTVAIPPPTNNMFRITPCLCLTLACALPFPPPSRRHFIPVEKY